MTNDFDEIEYQKNFDDEVQIMSKKIINLTGETFDNQTDLTEHQIRTKISIILDSLLAAQFVLLCKFVKKEDLNTAANNMNAKLKSKLYKFINI